MTSLNFTPRQHGCLKALEALGARSPATSRSVAAHKALSPMVLGKLRDAGLVDSATRSEGNHRWTEYWLTRKGVKAAEALPPAAGAWA